MLEQWVITKTPSDFPDGYVVRRWEIGMGKLWPKEAKVAATLEEARELIPPGMVRFLPHHSDDPHIVETWT